MWCQRFPAASPPDNPAERLGQQRRDRDTPRGGMGRALRLQTGVVGQHARGIARGNPLILGQFTARSS